MDNNLPSDPMMLMSMVNMLLRDKYPTLDALCDDMGIQRQWIEDKLKQVGMEYSEEQNKFW